MKLVKFLPPGLIALTVSIGVTAGSIYVTVNAAASNAAKSVTESVAEPSALTSSAKEFSASDVDVPLTADGLLSVQLSAIDAETGETAAAEAVNVRLTAADGVLMTTSTDADGFCAFGSLTPGIYTIEASGPQGSMSCGLRAVTSHGAIARTSAESRVLPVSLKLNAAFSGILAPVRDGAALNDIISNTVVTAVEFPAPRSESAPTAMEASYSPDSGAVESYEPVAAVQLTPDGSLEGQLHLFDPATGNIAPVTDLTVSFIADNAVAGTTTVNRDGSFVQWNLLPGVYTIVVAGQDGIGYLGLEVAGDFAAADRPGQPIPTAGRLQTPFGIGLVQGSGSGNGGGSSEPGEEGVEGPLGGVAGNGTGYAGGGGGVPGGGGWGELLGAAGVALGAAALASDDDGAASPAN